MRNRCTLRRMRRCARHSLAIIKHAAPIQRSRDGVLMRNYLRKMRRRLALLLHGPHKPLQSPESFHLLRLSHLRAIQSSAQNCNRLVVSLQRNRKWMPVLPAQRKRKTRRIGKAARRPMDHFRNQCQRLQRPGPKIFQQQQGSEVPQLTFISHRQYRPKPLQIQIPCAHVVMPWNSQFRRFAQCRVRFSRTIPSMAFCAGAACASTRFMIVP